MPSPDMLPVAIASVALFAPPISAGALRPLAVTSASRYAALPDTPTVGDLGVSGVTADTWWGMLAPAETPREIISRLHGLLTTALEEPAVKQSLSEQGLIYRGMGLRVEQDCHALRHKRSRASGVRHCW
jgi:tripartite-type tricarboxylate transporter receptor subunit TctC